ncbi:hypothetical protein V2E24_01415 [Mycoplasmopsis ciconiae]|uniref:Uncharacterized protein n=1 Tax=Mycoplasmopsis ciconiae TaxID=561067 RepID=A0ABU7ML36_9BACT|nr:hypothetical protein [Mycoplasmopsis ciconiae]
MKSSKKIILLIKSMLLLCATSVFISGCAQTKNEYKKDSDINTDQENKNSHSDVLVEQKNDSNSQTQNAKSKNDNNLENTLQTEEKSQNFNTENERESQTTNEISVQENSSLDSNSTTKKEKKDSKETEEFKQNEQNESTIDKSVVDSISIKNNDESSNTSEKDKSDNNPNDTVYEQEKSNENNNQKQTEENNTLEDSVDKKDLDVQNNENEEDNNQKEKQTDESTQKQEESTLKYDSNQQELTDQPDTKIEPNTQTKEEINPQKENDLSIEEANNTQQENLQTSEEIVDNTKNNETNIQIIKEHEEKENLSDNNTQNTKSDKSEETSIDSDTQKEVIISDSSTNNNQLPKDNSSVDIPENTETNLEKNIDVQNDENISETEIKAEDNLDNNPQDNSKKSTEELIKIENIENQNKENQPEKRTEDNNQFINTENIEKNQRGNRLSEKQKEQIEKIIDPDYVPFERIYSKFDRLVWLAQKNKLFDLRLTQEEFFNLKKQAQNSSNKKVRIFYSDEQNSFYIEKSNYFLSGFAFNKRISKKIDFAKIKENFGAYPISGYARKGGFYFEAELKNNDLVLRYAIYDLEDESTRRAKKSEQFEYVISPNTLEDNEETLEDDVKEILLESAQNEEFDQQNNENPNKANINVDSVENNNLTDPKKLNITAPKPLNKTNNTLRIGHWNVLNLSELKPGINDVKYYTIPNIIKHINVDLIGLTEINFNSYQAVIDLRNKLNEIDAESKWEYLYQPTSESNNHKSSEKTYEHIGILYKSTLFEPQKFTNNKIGDTFNQSINNIVSNQKIFYKRNPYGANFKIKNTTKTITTVFAHLDSPGSKSGEKTISKNTKIKDKNVVFNQSAGEIESSEAYELKKVMDYFDNIDGDSTLIFGGDTNIKEGNSSIFSPLISNGYTLAFGDQQKHATSLSKSLNKYSQPYDKIIFKEHQVDIISEDEADSKFTFMYDIWKAYESLLDKQKAIELIKNKEKINDINLVRNYISDHAPVFVDVKY